MFIVLVFAWRSGDAFGRLEAERRDMWLSLKKRRRKKVEGVLRSGKKVGVTEVNFVCCQPAQSYPSTMSQFLSKELFRVK